MSDLPPSTSFLTYNIGIPMSHVLFASHHCYLDQSNGASITARQILLELSARGWEVDAFCGAGFDYESGSAVDAALAQCDVVLRNRVDKHCNGLDCTLFPLSTVGSNQSSLTRARKVSRPQQVEGCFCVFSNRRYEVSIPRLSLPTADIGLEANSLKRRE